jgi:hypothetical protein
MKTTVGICALLTQHAPTILNLPHADLAARGVSIKRRKRTLEEIASLMIVARDADKEGRIAPQSEKPACAVNK